MGLPSNQVLAMFNKGIRKLSTSLNGVLIKGEKSRLLGGEERAKVERMADEMGDVSRLTLEEDNEEGAKEAMKSMNKG